MRRLLALVLLVALAPAASSARAEEPSDTTTVVVDWPGQSAAVASPVTLVGWAVSRAAAAGTGVDAIAVYLDGPAEVGTALGRAVYGQARPDVAAARGESRYTPSGWSFQAELPPGTRTLFVYAHLADRPVDAGWVGPWQVAVQVAGGEPVSGPLPREGPTTPIGPTAAMPSSRGGQAAGIAGGGSCFDREQGTGRCLTFGGSNYLSCAVPDPDSGRCLHRPSTANPGAGGPAGAAIRGSWNAYGLLSAGYSLGMSPVDGSLSGATSQPGSQLSGPLGYGLGSLLSQADGLGPGPAGGPGALAGLSAPSSGPSSASGPRARGLGSLSGTSGPSRVIGGGTATGPGAVSGAADAGLAILSLTATQVGRGQFQLNWNQMPAGANYEVRRCSGLSNPTITCTLVAVVGSSGSYGLLQGGGVYVVRALGPLGQLQGESNRVTFH